MKTKVARIFIPENALAKSLVGPDRSDCAELVQLANAQVASIADRLENMISERSAHILGMLRRSQSEVYESRHEIMAIAADITATAAPGRSEALGLFSRGLYLLIQGMEEQGVWRADILEVHANAFALACRAPGLPGLSKILSDLDEARRSIGITG